MDILETILSLLSNLDFDFGAIFEIVFDILGGILGGILG